MSFKIDSIYDIGRFYGWKEGEQEGEQKGEQKGVRAMLEQYVTFRFPSIARATIDGILSITDVNILKSIFAVACKSDSFEDFQRDIREFAPIR